MITHSLSSFIAQKYLESYSLKGLVLINPVPPVHTETMKNLLLRGSKCTEIIKSNRKNSEKNISSEDKDAQVNDMLTPFAQLYYNIINPIKCKSNSHEFESNLLPVNLMEYLANDKSTVLRLEKGKFLSYI